MKLYFSPGACSLSSHIVLHEAGVAFETERVDLKTKKTASGADFTRINPKGYVPVLELDDKSILTECAAIALYVADKAPAKGLAPKAGTMESYRLIEWLSYISTELHKQIGALFNPTLPDEARTRQRELAARRISFVEQHLAKHSCLMGNAFTVADAYCFTVLRWAPYVKIDMGAFTNIKAYVERVVARPGVQAALKAEGLLK